MTVCDERTVGEARSSLWRSRWAAIGAAVAVSVGAGGMFVAQAAPGTAESTIVSVTPERILDTRNGNDIGLAGPFVSAVAQKLQVTGSIPTATGTKTVVPTGATGVLLNVTPVGPTAAAFISIRPGDATGAASTSSLNFTAGAISPNSVQVAMPTAGANAGKIDITFDAYGVAGPTTDILIDVVGYTTNTGLQQLVAEVALKASAAEVATKASAADVFTKTQVNNLVAPLYVSVTPGGAVYAGASSGLVSVAKTATGSYTLTFNRTVSNCAVASADLIFGSTRDVSADPTSGAANQVIVRVTNVTQALEDTFFSVIVQCPPSVTGGAELVDAAEPSERAND